MEACELVRRAEPALELFLQSQERCPVLPSAIPLAALDRPSSVIERQRAERSEVNSQSQPLQLERNLPGGTTQTGVGSFQTEEDEGGQARRC